MHSAPFVDTETSTKKLQLFHHFETGESARAGCVSSHPPEPMCHLHPQRDMQEASLPCEDRGGHIFHPSRVSSRSAPGS